MDLSLFEPIASSSVANAIHQKMLGLIEEQRLVAGDRLPPERDLASAFRVSRTTVRDALRSLEAYGILEARHGAGWFVTQDRSSAVGAMRLRFEKSAAALSGMVEARLVLEPAIAQYAAEHRTGEDLERLTALLERLESSTDPSAYARLDSQFHVLLAECSHNPFLLLAARPVLSLMEESRRPMHGPLPKKASIAEHRRILAAIERGDGTAARAAMTRHLKSFQQRTSAQYQQPADGPSSSPRAATPGTEAVPRVEQRDTRSRRG